MADPVGKRTEYAMDEVRLGKLCEDIDAEITAALKPVLEKQIDAIVTEFGAPGLAVASLAWCVIFKGRHLRAREAATRDAGIPTEDLDRIEAKYVGNEPIHNSRVPRLTRRVRRG